MIEGNLLGMPQNANLAFCSNEGGKGGVKPVLKNCRSDFLHVCRKRYGQVDTCFANTIVAKLSPEFSAVGDITCNSLSGSAS